jgi:type II secretory pathway pseudopilin PulG
MSPRQARISWGLFAGVLGIVLTLTMADAQNRDRQSVEELIPASTVLFIGHDGAEKHKGAWEKTAAYEAMYESGLVAVFEKLFAFVEEQTGVKNNPEVAAAMKHLQDHGATIAVSLPAAGGPPIPQVTVILHKAAKYDPMLSGLVRNFGIFVGAQFEQSEVSERSITRATIPNTPGIEVGIWAEGEHLVIVAGMNAVDTGIAVASGETPNLSTNKVWKKYNYDEGGYEVTSVGWLDFEAIRKTYGQMPVPTAPGKNINDALRALGLLNLDAVACQYGYKDKSLWSETAIDVDGPRTGLLALCDQEPMTLVDLPPLPANTNGFKAVRMDSSATWDTLVQVVREGSAFGPPQVAGQVEGVLANLPQIIGFDPKADLFESLGDVVCLFADPDQGFLGTGTGLMIKVDDAEKLKATIDKLIGMGEQVSRGQFTVHRSDKHGRQLMLFEFGERVQAGALAIDDGWLIVGLLPQTVEAALLRIDGQLDTWQPTVAQSQAFESLPKSFTSITVGDPRVSWHALMKLAPILMSAGQVALKEERIIPRDTVLPITIADLPPAELVARPLFPNVTVTTSSENGVLFTSRKSLPGIPIIGGIGEGNGLVTVAIGTALLLPAVQQARAAARRSQSMNNMKQLGLALHNYHDVNGSLPAGTHPNEKLKPEKRLSWLASVLPFAEQAALFKTVDFEESWDDEANEDAANIRIATFMNPGRPVNSKGPGETHYVGIAGLGKDAPMLPANHKRAGMFGVNRKTRFRDVKDGLSNTMMTSEAAGKIGPWIAGGDSTIRPLTKKPYINGPDGIGGPYTGGCNIGLADGSVRFVSENIDPTVFERLSTIADGNPIGDF